MKFAVISDIHSNLYALKSVYESIKSKDINYIYCTGDLIGYFTDPNGVIDFIRQLGIECILGNHDEKYIHEKILSDDSLNQLSLSELQGSSSFHHNNQLLRADNRNYLKTMATSMMIKLEDHSIEFAHGSPDHISTYLYESDDKTDLAIKSLHDIIIIGHTHLAYHQFVEGVHFINSGSVGKSKDGDDRASYAVVTVDESVDVEFIKVDYNMDQLILDIKGSPMISNDLIKGLKQAK